MRRVRTGCVAVVVAVAAASACPVALATPQTFTVSGTGDPGGASCAGGSCDSLRAAVTAANANPGSTIQLQQGTFVLTQGWLNVHEPVTITGAGPGGPSGTTIEQESADSGVIETLSGSGTLAIDGVEIIGGTGNPGAGIEQGVAGYTLSLDDDLITGNTSTGFGGDVVQVDGDTVQGAGVAAVGPLQMSNSEVSDNHAIGGNGFAFTTSNGAGGNGGGAQGGGVWAGGATTITNSTISGNSVRAGNGGAGNGTGNAQGGGGLAEGGGIFVASTGQLTVASSTISDNTGTGGVGAIPPLFTIPPGTSGGAEGGGLYADGPLVLANARVTGDAASGGQGADGWAGPGADGAGGGIAAAGDATITDSTISGNTASGGAGGSSGGGAPVYGNNGAPGGNGAGGGVDKTTMFPFTVRSSTIAGNTAGGGAGGGPAPIGVGGGDPGPVGTAEGGGVMRNGGSAILGGEAASLIVNSTIADNTAADLGGGIVTKGTFGVHLASDTVADNQADDGASLKSVNLTTPLTVSRFGVENTILAAGLLANCDASISDDGHNLEDSGATSTCGFSSANGDVVVAPGASGVAASLADNGGSTQTLALSATSPAIGAGGLCVDPGNGGAALTVDQRGLLRPATCDIGAFEHEPPVSSAAPSISGTPAVGQTLTCAPGTFTGDGVSVTFQWQRGGSPITGAATATYVVQSADAGGSLTCEVTGKGTYGTASATSPAVSVPAATPPAAGTPSVRSQTDKVSSKGASAVRIGCTGGGPCRGTVQVSLVKAGGRAVAASAPAHTHKHKRTRVVIAKAAFSIPAGRAASVAIHLNGTGRRLLRAAHGRLHVTISLLGPGPARTVTASAKATVVLARARRRRHKH